MTFPANVQHLAAAIVMLASTTFAAEPTKDTLATVQKSITDEKAVLVDVREQSEWDAGHIAGAVFLPLSELREGLEAETLAKRLPKNRILYTHCVVGKRSLTAAEILLQHGYDVRSLNPGYKELIAAGFKKAE